MDEKTFKTRTKRLAIAIIHQTEKRPGSLAADVINKMKVVEEESDELLSMTVASIKTLRNRKSQS